MSTHQTPSSTLFNGAPARQPDEETPLLSESVSNTTTPPDEEQTIIPDEPNNIRLVITLGSIYVGVFLGAIDSTIIATLSAPISTSFNSLSLLSWLASAYLIANAACQPLSGRLTDIFSRRAGLVFSNFFFAVGNLICGLARDEGTMIAGRIVAGVGGGGLMAISTFVASDLVPLRKRGIIQGIGNICYGLGAGVGGMFGGWVNDTWGWRVAFLCQVPLVIFSGILVYFTVNIPPKKSQKSKISRVDFLGAFTIVVTLVLLLLGLNSGGNIVPWNHPLVLVSLPLSGVALAAFIYIEAEVAKEPMIPIRLVLNRTVAAACMTNWFATMVTYICLFYIPLYFQAKGLSTSASGMRLIPCAVGASAGSFFTGFIMNKTGKYQILGLASVTSYVIGTGLLCTMTFDMAAWPVFVFMSLIGLGYGGMLTVTLLATISAVDHEHQAVITSATYAFRSTGPTIGITIASAVYQNLLKTKLYARFGDLQGGPEEIEKIRENFDEMKHLPEGWKEGVLQSYEESLRGVFLTALELALLSLICCFFIREHVLHSTLARR